MAILWYKARRIHDLWIVRSNTNYFKSHTFRHMFRGAVQPDYYQANKVGNMGSVEA